MQMLMVVLRLVMVQMLIPDAYTDTDAVLMLMSMLKMMLSLILTNVDANADVGAEAYAGPEAGADSSDGSDAESDNSGISFGSPDPTDYFGSEKMKPRCGGSEPTPILRMIKYKCI